VNGRQVLARDVDDGYVDLGERNRRDRRMLQELLRRTAVTTADDQRTLGMRMGERREMDEILVIEELVLLGRHEMGRRAGQLAEGHAVVHLDCLIR